MRGPQDPRRNNLMAATSMNPWPNHHRGTDVTSLPTPRNVKGLHSGGVLTEFNPFIASCAPPINECPALGEGRSDWE